MLEQKRDAAEAGDVDGEGRSDDAVATSPRRMTPVQRAVQVCGLLVGIALMVWAMRLALSGDNATALTNLRNASPGLVAAIIAFSLISLALDALVFWVTLKPRRALPIGEMLATNCIAVFLSILPFKLGMLIRSAIHVRRHKVALKELVSWFIAFGGMSVAAITACAGGAIIAARTWQAPTLLATVGVSLGLLVLAWCAIVAVGMIAQRSNIKALRVMTLGTADLISHPTAVAAGLMLRALDVATFAARFAIAAAILGVPMSIAQSAQLGSVYLLLQAGAPAGALGFAEAGTAGAGKLIGMGMDDVARLALLMTAVRLALAGFCAAGAWLWLRPDRLLRA
jgi:hypothetical protein